jgi:hypothetical protein
VQGKAQHGTARGMVGQSFDADHEVVLLCFAFNSQNHELWPLYASDNAQEDALLHKRTTTSSSRRCL